MVRPFASTDLALRVAHYSKLDNDAAMCGLEVRQIVEGVCLDSRITNHDNNPSFGCVGNCLPKNNRQLLIDVSCLPESLIGAVVGAKSTRQIFTISQVIILVDAYSIKTNNKSGIGICRLIMKPDLDRLRVNAYQGIMLR